MQTGDNIIIAKVIYPLQKISTCNPNPFNLATNQLAEMVTQLELLQQNLQQGKLQQAQTAYIQAHQYYETVRLIIILFGIWIGQLTQEPIISSIKKQITAYGVSSC